MPRLTRYFALVALIICAGFWTIAHGQSGPCASAGCPDTTFGPGGIVTAPSLAGTIEDIVVQNFDGEERYVGMKMSLRDSTMARFLPNGRLDATFAAGGILARTCPNKTTCWSGDIVAQPDNKLVVVGQQSIGGGATSLALSRYEADGKAYDTSFGTGGTLFLGSSHGRGRLALQGDQILVATYDFVKSDQTYDLNVFRVNSIDGTLDEGFGTGGVAKIRGGGMARSLTVQQDKILLTSVVDTVPASLYGLWVARIVRLNGDGTRDETFAGGTGAATMGIAGAETTEFWDTVVDGTGRIVAVGYYQFRLSNGNVDMHALAARYDMNGVLDEGFTEAARAIDQPLDNPNARIAQIDSQGRILIVGGFGNKFSLSLSLVAWRLFDDGTPDTDFGDGGMATSSWMWPGGYADSSAFVLKETSRTFLVPGGAFVQVSKRRVADVWALGRFHY